MKPHCYTVFYAEQVEGLPVSFYAMVAPALSDLERIAAADRFFAAPRSDHAAYLASWLVVMKSDKRAIFSAAAHAQHAADYLIGLQPQAQELAA